MGEGNVEICKKRRGGGVGRERNTNTERFKLLNSALGTIFANLRE